MNTIKIDGIAYILCGGAAISLQTLQDCEHYTYHDIETGDDEMRDAIAFHIEMDCHNSVGRHGIKW